MQQMQQTAVILGDKRFILDSTTHIIPQPSPFTDLYPSDSPLIANWATGPSLALSNSQTDITFVHTSALASAQSISIADLSHIGLLHSANPKKAGGGSFHGSDDPESTLVRSSTLYHSLTSAPAAPFYSTHKKDDDAGFNDHQLLYSSHVYIFRDEEGNLIPPYKVSIVSAAPVNAQSVYAKSDLEQSITKAQIESIMKERMARVLRLFEERGDVHLVLGAFGLEFQNDVEMLGRIWAELLACDRAHFKGKFKQVIFAVPGRPFRNFKTAFELKVYEDELTKALSE